MLKIVPLPFTPPVDVVPYSSPSLPWMSAPRGFVPFAPENSKMVLIVPAGVNWKIVPSPAAPSATVVP